MITQKTTISLLLSKRFFNIFSFRVFLFLTYLKNFFKISMENETKEISILQQFSVGEAPPQAEDTSDESYDVEESSGGDEIELQASSEEDE